MPDRIKERRPWLATENKDDAEAHVIRTRTGYVAFVKSKTGHRNI